MRDDLVQHVQSVGNTVKGTVVRNKRKITATGALRDSEETPLLTNEILPDLSSDEAPILGETESSTD